MGHVVTTPQQPPKNIGTWLKFKSSGRSRPSSFAIAAWTLSIVFLCQLDAMAQPCNPLINATPDGGEINICLGASSYNVSPDNPPINNLTEGIFTSDIPPAHFMSSNNTGTVMTTTPPGSYSITYEVTADPSGDCNVGEMTTITLNIDDNPGAPTVDATGLACIGEDYTITPIKSATSFSTPLFTYTIIDAMTTGASFSGSNTTTGPSATLTGIIMTGTIQVEVTETNECGVSTAATTLITVNDGPDAAMIAGTATICAGDPTDLTVTITNVTGGTPPYTVVYTDGTTETSVFPYISGAPITVMPTMTSTYTVVSVTDVNTCSVPSVALTGSATVTVEGPITIDTEPADAFVCVNNAATFSVTATNDGAGGALMYQWEESTDGGTTFMPLADAGIYSGTMTNTLTINPVTLAENDYRYRVVITTPMCTETSMEATLTVEGDVSIVTQPSDAVECAGNPSSFNVVASEASGNGTLMYQWQVSMDNGTTFNDISNGTPYSGANMSVLMIDDVTGLNNFQYQVIVSTAGCTNADAVTSDPATLIVEGMSIVTQPMDTDACEGNSASFSVVASNGGAGTLAYQWEFSIDSGTTYNNVPDDATYDDVTTANLLINDATGLDGNLYRVNISIAASSCPAITSDAVLLSVESPISITMQPMDVTECSGNGTTFSATIDNPTAAPVTYQWQLSTDGGTTYNNVLDDATYDDVTTTTLVINDVTSLGGNLYQLEISSTACPTQTTNAASLTVEGPIVIDNQPMDVTECAGNGTSFSVTATNNGAGTLNYQWQVSTDNGANYNIIPDDATYDDVMTPTLVVHDVEGLNGNLYQVLVSTATCAPVTSSVATLVVEGPLTVATQPVDMTECAGNSTTFSATINNTSTGTISYQWQISNNGLSFTNLSNDAIYTDVTTPTLTINDVTGLDGLFYRLQYNTTTCFFQQTMPATLTVEGPLTVTSQPTDETVCAGNSATFSASVSNAASGNIDYQWEVSSDGFAFTDVPDDATYSGVTTQNLVINDVTGLDGMFYRLRYSTATCFLQRTDAATLTVEGPLSITTQPMDVTECGGNSTNFSVVVDNPASGSITYQWQESTNGGTSYNNLNNSAIYGDVDSDNLIISDVTGLGGNLYRVVISSGACTAQFSTEALLTVEGMVTIATQPMDVTECAGNATTFSVTANNAGGGIISYQWQLSTDGGTTYTNVPNDATYDDETMATLTIHDVNGLDGTMYRVEVSNVSCGSELSDAATLTVEGSIDISSQPMDVTECSGNSTSFSVMATNMASGNLTYQWRFSTDGGTTYNNVPDDVIYDDVTTPTLTIHEVMNLNGNLYQVEISNTACGVQMSDAALLTVEGPITITSQPTDVTDCAGSSATFFTTVNNAGAGTISYQWEVSPNGFAYSDVPDDATYDGGDTPTLVINDITGLDGMVYRAKISTPACGLQRTDAANLTVDGALMITSQPMDVTDCTGASANFSVTINNNGAGTLSYQWQFSTDDGATYMNVPDNVTYDDEDTPNLIVHDITGLNANLYRVEVNGTTCGTRISDAAILNVDGAITITTQPMDMVACVGEPTTFSVNVNNDGSGTLAYQWQVSTDGGTSYMDVQDDADYDDVNTTILMVHDVTGFDGYFYRVEISGTTCPTQLSEAALLTVEGEITITNNPVDVTTCAGNSADFSVSATNAAATGTLMYQWQESTDGGVTYNNLVDDATYNNVTTTTLTIVDVTGLNTHQYRALVSTAACAAELSDAATLTVEGPLTITTQPMDGSVCVDGNTSFSVVVNNPAAGTIAYQWQVSTDNGATFNNVMNDATYNNVNTDVLTITDVNNLDGNQYRVAISTGACSFKFSNAATLTLEGPISITSQPSDMTACAGSGSSFSVMANSGMSGTLTYQWQVSTDGGSTYTNVPDDATYDDVTTAILTINNVAGLDNQRYQVLVATMDCAAVTSSSATLTVEGPLSILSQPINATACSGNPSSFSVVVDNAASGTVLYQWQVSADNGATFMNVSDDATYDDVTTSTLAINDVANLNGNQYRVQVSTTTCSAIISTAATLMVEGPITFTDHPMDIIVCEGNTASFSAMATNSGSGTLSYQWQVSTGSGATFMDVMDDATYDNVTTTTLNINDVTGLNGNEYRLVASTVNCDDVFSNAATLNTQNIDIVTQPMDETACAGSSLTFFAMANNSGVGSFNYQWQLSTDDGATFSDILATDTNYSGAMSATLNIADITDLNANQYRVFISTSECADVSSDAATLTVEGPIDITTQPTDQSVCEGEATTFSITAVNNGEGTLAYQWQVSFDEGANYSNLINNATYSGVDTPDLMISDVSTFDNYRYRALVATSSCMQPSDAATLTVEEQIMITSHPVDRANCAGGSVTFSVAAMGDNGSPINYTWQESTDNGATFTTLADGGIYGGASTTILTISNTNGLNGRQYRAQVSTGACPALLSNVATLTVEGPLTIVAQPMDVTVCDGAMASFAAMVTNGGAGTIAYRWQFRNTNSGGGFVNVPDNATYDDVNTATLKINNTSGLDGFRYRLIAATSLCTTISTPATLTVDGPIVFVEQPQDAMACSDGMASFSAFANFDGAGSVNYQWQVSTDNGATFNDIPVGTPYNGTTSTMLTINPITGLDGNQYRLEASSPGCQEVYSNAATLTENIAPTASISSSNSVVCQNETVDLMATITGGNPPYSHAWEIVDPQPATFNGTGALMNEDMANATFRGIQAGMIRLSYTATSADGCEAAPAFIDIEVLLRPAVNDIMGNNTVCPAQTETYAVFDNPGSTYQWTLLSGGTIVGSSTGATVMVEWEAMTGGPHTLNLVETFVNNCSTENHIEVNIVDLETPTFTCIGNQNFTTSDDNLLGDCQYEVTDNSLDITIDSEDCGIAEILHDYNGSGSTLMGQAFPIGTTSVTWTVRDNAGNTATCTFTITVTDDEAPLFSTCPSNIVFNNDMDECSALVAFNLPVVTDNCSVTGIDNLSPNNPNTGQTYTSGDAFPVGTTTMLYRATDAEGNTSDCSFNITVNDTQLPVANCQNITLELSATGTATLTAVDINNFSTDNCGIAVFLVDDNSFDCNDIGNNTVNLTIRDDAGNEDMCAATVTVEDNVTPTLTCPDDFIVNACSSIDAPPYATFASFQNAGGSASDNCTVDASTWTHLSDVSNAADCPEIITRTYQIADESGNTGTCEQVITVQDIQFPSIAVPSAMTLSCDQATDPTQTGTATVSDNCGSVTVTFQDQIFDGSCDNEYTIVRTWTAADACGNSVSAGQQITIQDNDAPVFSTLASNLTIDCNNNGTDAMTAIDNWLANNGEATAADNCGAVTFTNNYNGLSNACGTTGTANVTFTATDECGNSVNTTATISITDTQAPTWTTNPSDLTVECDDQDQLTAWLNNGGNGTATDACGEVSIDFQITNQSNGCGQSSIITVNFIATDECGNSSTRTATANVEDNTAPLFDETPPLLNDIACHQNFPTQMTLTATDNCGQVSVTESVDDFTVNSCEGYTVTYRWMAEDDCDNQTVITRSFDVLPDTEAPNFIIFPGNLTVDVEDLDELSEQGVEDYLVSQNIVTPSAADACGTAEITFTTNYLDENLQCPTAALYNRVYTTTDDCGNSRNRTFQVRVVESGTLAAVCQPVTVVLQNNVATITLADIDNGSTVACGTINLSISQSQFGQNDLGANNVTLTVSDGNGNSATCTAVVTVEQADVEVTLTGNIATEAGNNVGNTTVNWLVNGQPMTAPITNNSGDYNFTVQNGDDVEIRPFKDINPKNGLSTFDLVLIHQHVLNINYLPSPYQRIAADANNDGVISTADLIRIQPLIVNNADEFPENTSWRFAVANPTLQNLPNPALVPDYEEALFYNDVNSDQLNGDFVAIKIGDVNGSAIVNNFGETNEVENRSSEQVILQIDNSVFNNGVAKDREYHMNITIQDFEPLLACQLGLRFNQEVLEFKGVNTTNLPNFKNSNIGSNKIEEGILRLNWWNQEAVHLADGSTLFTLVFKAKKDANRLDTPIVLDENILSAEFYTADLKISSAILTNQKEPLYPTVATDQPLVLQQNRPNPFSGETIIGFYLPTATTAALTILDATGKIIKTYQGDYPQGFNEITVDLSDITIEGNLVYQLRTPNASASKFMIKIK